MLKKLSFSTAILLSLFIIFSFQKSMADEKEEAAIKKVIEAEDKFFNENNYEELAKTWVHAPYALMTSTGNSFNFEFNGWDSIGINYKRWTEGATEPFTDEIIHKNYSYRIYGNGAWVTFEQYRKSSMEKNPEYLPGKALRVLEKTDDGWKIVYWGYIGRYSYE